MTETTQPPRPVPTPSARVMTRKKLVMNKVTVPVGFGLIGFILGVFLFYGKLFGKKSDHVSYQELVIHGKTELVNQVLADQMKIMRDSIAAYEKNDRLTIFQKAYTTVRRDSILLSDGNADTTLAYLSKYLLVNRDSIRVALSDSNWKGGLPYIKCIPALLIDSNPLLRRIPVIKRVQLQVERDQNTSLMDFFSKNSLFAFWLIFSIAQFSLWFMVVPILAGLLDNLKKTVQNVKEALSYQNWLLSGVLPGVFIIIFCVLLYWFLIDVNIINNQYFLEKFTDKMYWYAGVGYLAAVACLAMFLLMSISLDQLNSTTLEASTDLQNDEVRMTSFITLKKGFDNSFFASAIILSVFVLWVGITFQAVNHTEAMRLYSMYAGKPFLNYDFVYLVGCIHTLILLIFYIPVKLKFNALPISTQAADARSGNKLWTELYGTLSSIFITTSPLIASVLQHLFSALSN